MVVPIFKKGTDIRLKLSPLESYIDSFEVLKSPITDCLLSHLKMNNVTSHISMASESDEVAAHSLLNCWMHLLPAWKDGMPLTPSHPRACL